MIYNSRNIVGLKFYNILLYRSDIFTIIKDKKRYTLKELKYYQKCKANVFITNLETGIWVPVIPIITTKSWFRLKMMFI